MITGLVNDELEVMLTVAVHGDDGQGKNIPVQLDTGFSGALILPEILIKEIGLVSDGVREAALADGQVIVLATYRGTVIWDGAETHVEILASTDVPLVGMELLRGFQIRVDAVPGGTVTIEGLN
jgi:clan AA aspartic protease